MRTYLPHCGEPVRYIKQTADTVMTTDYVLQDIQYVLDSGCCSYGWCLPFIAITTNKQTNKQKG